MNWIFLDVSAWDYDVASPSVRPLGGSQSAMCYLATALAACGEQVTTLTATSRPRQVNGVRCLQFENIPREVFAPADTVTVVLNGPADMGQLVRETVPSGQVVVLWNQHAHDQPAISALRDPGCLACWDHIVCVSDWQKRTCHTQLGIPLGKMEVLRNGIAPVFERVFDDAGQLAAAKSGQPRLVYTSTPFRGLEVLVACMPAISRKHPGCRLDVFSSMQVYYQAAESDPYQPLYDQCRATAGVNYRGSLGQAALAQELAGASILAYPNVFPETSCIAVMEALAAGLRVVTSDLGALPETCAGFAQLIPPPSAERTVEQFAIDFAWGLDQALNELAADPAGWSQRQFAQAEAIGKRYSYDVRAGEWIAAAKGWLAAK